MLIFLHFKSSAHESWAHMCLCLRLWILSECAFHLHISNILVVHVLFKLWTLSSGDRTFCGSDHFWQSLAVQSVAVFFYWATLTVAASSNDSHTTTDFTHFTEQALTLTPATVWQTCSRVRANLPCLLWRRGVCIVATKSAVQQLSWASHCIIVWQQVSPPV